MFFRLIKTLSRTVFEKHLPGAFLEMPFGTKKKVRSTHFKWCLVVTKHQNFIPCGKRGTHQVAKRVRRELRRYFESTSLCPTLLYICFIFLFLCQKNVLFLLKFYNSSSNLTFQSKNQHPPLSLPSSEFLVFPLQIKIIWTGLSWVARGS